MIVNVPPKRSGWFWGVLIALAVLTVLAGVAVSQPDRLKAMAARLVMRLDNEFGRRDYVYRGPPASDKRVAVDVSGVIREASPPVLLDVDAASLKVRWSGLDNADMADYFPQKALEKVQPGEVVLACRWDGDGRITACTIIDEAPKGYGFGTATLKMLYEAGRVESRTPGDAVVPGEGIKMRFKWTLQ